MITLDERIKTTDADIEDRFRRHPLAEVITSLPGMGFRLGAEFLAAVGDPALIGSANQLAAWAGLAPVSKDSENGPDDCTHPSATAADCAGSCTCPH